MKQLVALTQCSRSLRPVPSGLAISVHPVTRDQRQLDPAEQHTGHGWFLLSSGSDSGGHF